MATHDPSRRPSWAVLGVVTAAMGAGPLYNFGFAATSALIITTFGITSAQFGAILTVVFGAAALTSLLLGWLSDRLPPHAQFTILFGGAAVSLVGAGFAPSYAFLLATAVFAGLSQAMSNATTNRAVSALAPDGKRAGWIGVKQSGVQASQFIAGLVFPALAVGIGWAGAATAVSALCIVMLVLAFLVVPDWTKDGAASAAAHVAPPPMHTSVPTRDLWLIVGMLAAISLFTGFGAMATNAYLALFAVQEFGYPLWLGGLVVAVGGIIGVASRIFWGRQLSGGRTVGALMVIMSVGAISVAASLMLAGAARLSWLVWVGVTLHGASVLGANVITNSALMRIAGPARLGLATGVTTTGMFTGFAIGPLVVGYAIERSGFGAGWLTIGVVYVACLVVSLVFARLTRDLRFH